MSDNGGMWEFELWAEDAAGRTVGDSRLVPLPDMICSRWSERELTEMVLDVAGGMYFCPTGCEWRVRRVVCDRPAGTADQYGVDGQGIGA